MGGAIDVALRVAPLRSGLPFGAIVSGLRREQLGDPGLRRRLLDLWIEAGVILFRDGDSSDEMQIELSQCFGPLERSPFKETWHGSNPDLVHLSYTAENGTCYEVKGEQLGNYIYWHKDRIYTDKLNRGGILKAVQLSQAGGQTGFIDLIDAYARLSPALKERIAGRRVVYSTDLNLANSKFLKSEQIRLIRATRSLEAVCGRLYQYPLFAHPLVFTQVETGRNVLNISPSFALGFYEDGGPAGDALLQEVIDSCTSGPAYFHEWRPDDMLLWDNWRMIHCVTGIPPEQTRTMKRTSIFGDYGLGRALTDGFLGFGGVDV